MGGCPRMRECPSPWGSRRSAWVSPNSVLDSRPESRAFSMVGTAGGCPTISKVSRRRAGASMGVPEFPGWWVSRNFHVISNGWWVSLNSLPVGTVGGCPRMRVGWWVSHNFRPGVPEQHGCQHGCPGIPRLVGVPQFPNVREDSHHDGWVSPNAPVPECARMRLVGLPQFPRVPVSTVGGCPRIPAMGGCLTIPTRWVGVPQFSGFFCASGRVTLVPGWW